MNQNSVAYLLKRAKDTLFQIILSTFFLVSAITLKAQNSANYTWNSISIGGGGFVSGIITSKEQPGLMYARTDVGGAYRWDISGKKWIPLTDWASDQQQGVLGVESIAIDPKSPNIVYMATGISYFNSGKSYILRSTDYGANFTITDVTSQFKMHGNGMGRQNGEKLQVDPNNSAVLYYGSRRNGLFKSTNSGATWSPVGNIPSTITITANDNGFSFLLLDKSSVSGNNTQRIFAGISRSGNNQNFYRSDDGGATFTAVNNSNLAAGLMPQRAVFSGDGHLYITYANGAGPYGTTTEPMDQGQIWKYNIASGAWTNISPSLNRSYGGISVDPANPQRLVASTINTYLIQGTAYGDRFFISTNGGTSWTDIINTRGFSMETDGVTWVSTSSIHWAGSIEFDPSNPDKVLVTSGNGIFVNEDINNSKIWKFNVKGLEETVPLNFVSIPGGPGISVIGDYDGFRHTDVSAYAPIHIPKMGSTPGLAYAAGNTSKVVRVGSSMYYSEDMGLSWTKTATINGTKGQVALSADGNILLHSPDASAITYKSLNKGTSWATVSGLNITNARPVADGFNSNKFYAYEPSGGVFYISTDGGGTFNMGANVGSNGSKIIRTVPGRDGHIWIALYNGGLSRSTNSGTTFTSISSVTQCGAVGIGKAAPGSNYETIYIYGTVAGVLGVHRSIDEGATWIRVNDDTHQFGGPANGQFVVGDMNVYGRVYMSTAGRGIVYGEGPQKRIITFNTSQFSIDENSIAGTNIGIPVATNEPNLHNWSILSGNTGNIFSIDAATGKIIVAAGAVLDFESKASYALEIGFQDNLNNAAQGNLLINLNNVNEAPLDISISKSAILQNNTIGAVVGNLNTTDADASSTFTYTLVAGTGGTDNGAFSITGSQLKATQVFNYNTKSVYSIRVKTIDNGNLSFEKVLTINVNKVSALPVSNFTVKAFNELCSSNNDGKITISAAENLSYKATLTQNTTNTEFPFTTNLEIPSLSAGTYSLCITAEGLANYKQCYDLVISEPQPLSVYSSVNLADRRLVLNLAGAGTYQIRLNGKDYNIASNSVTFDLVSGLNSLLVNTDKSCQGIFSKEFFIEDGKRIYPNPFDKFLFVSMGNDTSSKALISLYTFTGILAYSQEVKPIDSAIQLDMSELNSGTYIMKVKSALSQSSSIIVKK